MMYRTLMAAVVSTAAFCVQAQVEVEDRRIPSVGQAPAAQPMPASNITAEMHYQLQVLQQEVLQLRGMVEQQANEIKKLKQQRLDDYIDLDRRVSQLGQGSANNSATVAGDAPSGSTLPKTAPSSGRAPANELKQYRAAMNLVLKERKYDEAVKALEQYLSDYPKGRYAANSQYWLGEVYLLSKSLEDARSWFSRVLQDFPSHSKVPDAQYKLGIVYDMLGDKASARELLEKAAQSNSNAAKLARDYLSNNLTP